MAKFSLDPADEPFKEKLLFWITRYVRNKATTLSVRLVKDQDLYNASLRALQALPDTIDDIATIVYSLRKSGVEGVKSFFIPVEKFYHYALSYNLADMVEIDEEFVIDFLTSTTSSFSDATKKNYKNAIVNFLNYVSRNNEKEPGSGIGYIYNIDLRNWQGLGGKSGSKMPAYLNEDEFNRLLSGLETYPFPSERSAFFHKLIVKILAYTGLRIHEALALRKKDIKHEEKYILFYVTGKGNKDRTLSVLSEKILEDIERWNEISLCQNALFFCAEKDQSKAIPGTSVSIFISKLLRYCGIKKTKEGAHLLRHTYATMVYKKTKDLALLQDLLGHEDPSTTRIYAHIDNEEKKKVADIFQSTV